MNICDMFLSVSWHEQTWFESRSLPADNSHVVHKAEQPN